MKKRWFFSLFASIPVIAAVLALQSCGGVGGSTSNAVTPGPATDQFILLLSDAQRKATSIPPEACNACHSGKGGPDAPIYQHWKDTKHSTKGVNCESCHGPGGAHKAKPSKANILTYPKITDPVVCGQCHGTITDQYNFSGHAKLIADPVEEAITDPDRYGKTSRCIVCHSGLVRAEVTENGEDISKLSNKEIQELCENTIKYVPHTADCVTCHNPHKKTNNLGNNGAQAQLRHKIFNVDTTDIGPGKTADKFTEYDHICAQCHNGRGTNPADFKLETGTARPSMHDSNQMQMLMGFGGVEGTGVVKRNTAHAQAPGQCTKCHMPDSRHSFTVSFDKGCAPCHTPADAAQRANTIKSDILSLLVSLRTRMESWAKTNLGNSMFWEYTSNINAEGLKPPDQTLVPIEIKRARHNYYFVIRSGDYGVHNAPYAKTLIQVANDNLTTLKVPKVPAPQMTRDQQFQLIEKDKARASKADLRDTRS